MHNFLLTDDGRVLHFRNNTWVQVNRLPMQSIRFRGMWTPITSPTLPTLPTGLSVRTGDCFTVSVAGSCCGYSFQAGDSVIATRNNPSTTDPTDGWTIISQPAMTEAPFSMGTSVSSQPVSTDRPIVRDARPTEQNTIFGPPPETPTRRRPTPVEVSNDISAAWAEMSQGRTVLPTALGAGVTVAGLPVQGVNANGDRFLPQGITGVSVASTAGPVTIMTNGTASSVSASMAARWANHASSGSRDPIVLPAGHEITIVTPTNIGAMWGYLFALLQDGEYVQVGRSRIGTVGLFDIVLFTASHQECIQITEVEEPQQAVTMVADGLVRLRAHALLPPPVTELPPAAAFPEEPALEEMDNIRPSSRADVILDENGDPLPF